MAHFTINKTDINGKNGESIKADKGGKVSFKTGGGRPDTEVSIEPVIPGTHPLFDEGDSFTVTSSETSRTVSNRAQGKYRFEVPKLHPVHETMPGEITVNSGY